MGSDRRKWGITWNGCELRGESRGLIGMEDGDVAYKFPALCRIDYLVWDAILMMYLIQSGDHTPKIAAIL